MIGSSPGRAPSVRRSTWRSTTAVVPFNDLEALDRRLGEGDVACLLMEPALTNIGIVLPEDGYLAGVREITRRHGVLLVIDETHTLCAGPGGCTRAWGLEPDFVVVGKPIGGGVPSAAYGMSAEIADQLSGPMLGHEIDVAGVGGTLTANALALAAIRATLSSSLREEDFAVAIPLAERFTEGVTEVIDRHELPWHVQRLGCRAEYWFCPPPRDGAAAAAATDEELEGFCTCGRSTAACCSRRSTTWRCSARTTPPPTSTATPRSSPRQSPPWSPPLDSPVRRRILRSTARAAI